MKKIKTKIIAYGSIKSCAILIPSHLRNDSAFPLGDIDSELEMEIIKDTVVISKLKTPIPRSQSFLTKDKNKKAKT